MIDWLRDNADLLELGIGACTLLVWIVYAQLLFAGYRRHRMPSLIINRGRGADLDTPYVVGNMSEEAVYVQYVVAELTRGDGTISIDATDRELDPPGGERDGDVPEGIAPALGDISHQGPLRPNETFRLASGRRLLDRLAREDVDGLLLGAGDERFASTLLTLRLIAHYGPESRPIGAERAFRIERTDAGLVLVPESWNTRRLASRRERRALEREVDALYRREIEALRARR